MNRQIRYVARLDTLVLQLWTGDRVHNIEITRESDALLIRIPDYNVVDLLPLSHQAAAQLLDRLPQAVDRYAWMAFLTDPLSLERALGFPEESVASPA
ncbi:MAG TPA: hypothetical protein VN950_03220 [Terriglobales bacterium]|nr:hypothetical protein [Terriglobales bacterium]